MMLEAEMWRRLGGGVVELREGERVPLGLYRVFPLSLLSDVFFFASLFGIEIEGQSKATPGPEY